MSVIRVPITRNTVVIGDCLEILKKFPDNTFHSVVSDPPYGLEFMGKEWDAPWKANWQSGGGFSKPGIGERETPWPSFSATTRYGGANPTCDRCGGRARGAKKCSCETPEWKPIGKRRNPDNEGLPDDVTGGGMAKHMQTFQMWCESWASEMLRVLKPGGYAVVFGGSRTYHRMACALEDAGFEIRDQLQWLYGSGFPKSLDVSKAINEKTDSTWDGWGTALKPAHEPIVLARKPMMSTVAANILKYGVGALNIDASRIPTDEELKGGSGGLLSNVRDSKDYPEDNGFAPSDKGRWPANVMHDGSDEVTQLIGASCRFFYCPKVSKAERNAGLDSFEEVVTDVLARHRSRRMEEMKRPDGHEPAVGRNHHPTVKPIELMRYLCRLVTPPGGLILDPFLGSGSTAIAAEKEGFGFIGIERDEEYVRIALSRIRHWRENQKDETP